MITTSPLTDLADLLAQKLNAGTAARETFGSTELAFQWLAGLPSVLAKFVATGTTDGLSFRGVRVKPSGTPVAKVAPAAAKPDAIVLENFDVDLAKYSGMSIFTLEQSLTTQALLPAIAASLVQQSLKAFDTDAVAQLDADHDLDVDGADWGSGILAGIAAVAGNGGNPDLLVLSPSDYAEAVSTPAAVFSTDLSSGVTALYGLTLAVVIGAPAGVAYVMDSQAVVCVEHAASPIAVADPFSLSVNNQVRLITDVLAATVVTQPGSVAAVTVTAAPLGSRGDQSDYSLGA